MVTQLFFFAVAIVVIAVAAFQLGKKALVRPKHRASSDKRITTSRIRSSKDPSLECDLIILENHGLDEALEYFNRQAAHHPALHRLVELYQVERRFPDLSHFRLGPNMFDKITLDWIICFEPTSHQLVGHGITTRIAWDQNKEHLPSGWQGVVRTSYLQTHVEHADKDTLVGLFIFIEDQFRQQGWANNVIEEMRSLAKQQNLRALIIPLRPPLRYKKEYAAMPMVDFAGLRRDDGHPQDHWIRLHTRLGAKVLCASEKSHQHAMSVQDFHSQFSATPLTHSGDVLIERNGEWYKIYADLEHDFVLINQGCVWVQHEF